MQSIACQTDQTSNIEDCCSWVDVFFPRHWTGWEFLVEWLLKLQDMVFQVSLNCCHLQKFVCVYLAQSFNVNGSSLFVDSMITLRIAFLYFFKLCIIKLLYTVWKLFRNSFEFCHHWQIWPVKELQTNDIEGSALRNYLLNRVNTKFFSPFEHISPHILSFLHIEFASFQKSGAVDAHVN